MIPIDSPIGSRSVEIALGVAVGFVILAAFAVGRAVVGFGEMTSTLELVAGAVGPFAGGVVTGLFLDPDTDSPIVHGLYCGGVLAIGVVLVGWVNAVLFSPPGSPVDVTVTSPIGYAIVAVVVGIGLLPTFAGLGALGAVIGSALSR